MMFLQVLLQAACLAVIANAQTPKVVISTFDGAAGTTQQWTVKNDPVMGGVSDSVFNISSSLLFWDGTVKNVPSLAAPGFCSVISKVARNFPSAAGTNAAVLLVRTTTPQFAGFKISFAANTLNPQFKSYKANFNITQNNTWQQVIIPWTSFANDWSPYTGNCDTKDPTGVQHYCCSADHPEVCIKDKDLAAFEQIEIWAEGSGGEFHLQMQWIGATIVPGLPFPDKGDASVNTPTDGHNLTCKVQRNLRFNVSNRLAADYLPLPPLPLEGLAEAICCDTMYAPYAEPRWFFNRTDVNLYATMAKDSGSGPTTFFDAACGLPVYIAPRNRTMADFMADTDEHGWPSFRPPEIVTENVFVDAANNVISRCGTHLGTFLPDARGPRHCIDLSCVAGNPASATL